LIKILNSAGFNRIVEAANGREALDALKHLSPDIILMDIKMPVMDGFEATTAIRDPESEVYRPTDGNVHPSMQKVPIIAVSASAFEEDRQKILAAGADDLIRKPFHDTEILVCIGHHLGVVYLYEEGQKTYAHLKEEKSLAREISGLPVDLLEKIRSAALHGEVAACMTVVEKIRQLRPSAAVALEQVLKLYQFDKLYTIVQNEIKAHRKEVLA
jgi:CheY-like chemotaxis protein